MTQATGVRIGWTDLPGEVRAAIEDLLGSPVVEAVSQPGGFSPGTADRVRTAAGTRAFVKAVGTAQNPVSVDMHRREAAVTARLPAEAAAPRLLGTYDDGEWVALVLEDVPGRHPHTPWQAGELGTVLAVLRDLARRLTPSPVTDIPPVGEVLGSDLGGWKRIAADPPADLDPWAERHLDRLCALADRMRPAIAGDTLVHLDLRADNVLVGPDGRVTLVDWPWACRGAPWLDTVLLLINVRLFGGQPADRLLAEHTPGVDPQDLTAVLAGMAGFFLDAARQPDPPGLPTVRDFQRAQGVATLAWVRERLDAERARL
jgi:aminoglycoside phosphotransferase (APT) family kinase protein